MISTLCAVWLCLLLSRLLLELHIPIMHHSTYQLVDADLLLSGEAEDVDGALNAHQSRADVRAQVAEMDKQAVTHIGGDQLFAVINTRHADLPLADERVVVGVVGDEESF